MTYEEICKMILTLCNSLFDSITHDEEGNSIEENSITVGAEMYNSYRLKVTIEKEDIR